MFWNPGVRFEAYFLALPREYYCPELRDCTANKFYIYDYAGMLRRLFMIIRSLYGQTKEICNVSAEQSEIFGVSPNACFRKWRKNMRCLKALVRVRNTFFSINMRIADGEEMVVCETSIYYLNNLRLLILIYISIIPILYFCITKLVYHSNSTKNAST